MPLITLLYVYLYTYTLMQGVKVHFVMQLYNIHWIELELKCFMN